MKELLGVVRNYAWGDQRIIADLQGRPASEKPEAELWFGAHPSAPSRLAGSGLPLDRAVEHDPSIILGPAVFERFGRFPFLLKVLAAAEPLSIQAHPNRPQAEAGFATEEAAGVAIDDPKRTYRDDNHKPEILCALTPFEAKCGFRSLEQTASLFKMLAKVAGGRLDELTTRVEAAVDSPRSGLADILDWLLRLPTGQARTLVEVAVGAARQLIPAVPGEGPTPEEGSSPFYAELAWTVRLDEIHRGDIGVVVALLLNHVVLAPGQALFLGAGNLHAYLAGSGVELMANSDNVVRGGLTIKPMDVDALLAIVDTSPARAPIQTPVAGCHQFDAPTADFSLTRLGPDQSQWIEPTGPEILLVTAGEASVSAADGSASILGRGQTGLICWADGVYRIETRADTIAWRATVGDLSSEEGRR